MHTTKEGVIMKQKINKYHLSTKLISLIFAIGFIFICSSAYCQDDCEKDKPADDKWNFLVTPYFQVNSFDVDTTINGITAPVDLSFSDIIDTFDVLAFAVRTESRKGESKWGILLDGWYVSLESDFRTESPYIEKVSAILYTINIAIFRRVVGDYVTKEVCYAGLDNCRRISISFITIFLLATSIAPILLNYCKSRLITSLAEPSSAAICS